ncbi:hypothetical protein NLU13_0720 [Sarocladium strictum]|uniref:Uncharacterized protein n=1 Tax=Sarocladium strictum TaxID=5046 RepID=A0AA39LBS4_SARSR|nr:hypothetical protein NLU13_0720 [Sarocladium strictum]
MVCLLSLLGLASLVAAKAQDRSFKNFVVFGDSYTDEQNLAYLMNHGGEWPPRGTVLGPVNKTGTTGGYTWPRIAVDRAGAKLFNFAVAGASCSEKIIYRRFDPLNGSFPGVLEREVPAFEAQLGSEPYSDLTAENTVYGLWIGTNDFGNGAFLTDQQQPGKIITDYIDCIWDVYDRLYATGARRFVLLNLSALDKLPQYDASQGLDTIYFPDHRKYNMTMLEYKIRQYTTTVNTAFDYGVPFQVLVKDRWPGATFSIFNVHQLILDIYNNPGKYLAAPANATGVYRRCNPEVGSSDCEDSKEPLASFLWFDELHIAERTDEYVAKEFNGVVSGDSKYGTTYKSPSKCEKKAE